MKCNECGFENADGSRYCNSCGAPLAGAGPSRNADSAREAGSSPGPEPGIDLAANVSGAAGERLGPYELRGELGRGAMARVWRAWDPNLGREVAIKEPVFDPGLGDEVLAEMGKRFVREAKTAARLNHPGIVTIYAADVYDGKPAIVMELVEGATLGEILEDSGSLPPEAALDVLDQLLDAVDYAHGQGVVHRDIKPDNIFVSKAGRVKLADFGIAHVDDGVKTRATIAGSVLGTPGYMSPEQAVGATVDSRSDLFSIGVVGYEMLSGSNPFTAEGDADTAALLYRIVHEPVPELPESASSGLPSDLRPPIMAALSKRPEGRPQTAADFKAMLHGAAMPLNSAPASNVHDRMSKPPLSKWLPYVVVAACALALVIVFVLTGSNSGGGSVASGEPSSASARNGAATAEAGVEVHAVVDEYSWEDLSAISAEMEAAEDDESVLEIAKHYNLCGPDGKLDGTQAKMVEFDDGQAAYAQIIGFNHDVKAQDGDKAGISFLLAESIAGRAMNGDGSSDGGWRDSELRKWLNEDCFASLPSDLQASIKPVNKETNNVGRTKDVNAVDSTQDMLWIPSAHELYGVIDWATGIKAIEGQNKILNAEGDQYRLFAGFAVTSESNHKKLKKHDVSSGEGVEWWTRSARPSETGYFYYVDVQGNPHCKQGVASDVRSVTAGFCV